MSTLGNEDVAPHAAMFGSSRDLGMQTKLLAHAGKLLLEYNESTGAIHRILAATSTALAMPNVHIFVSYDGVTVSGPNVIPVMIPVRNLKYNTAVQARVHEILERVCVGRLDPATAIIQLQGVEGETPRTSHWIAVLTLSLAAASLAAILGADQSAVLVSGVSTGLGLFFRQELGRRHFNTLLLPLSAALIGAILGGLVVRWNWTRTPELAIIVPALMLVPGPHLINGMLDLIDNFLPMSMARLGLAAAILLASALGVVLGVELTLPNHSTTDQGADGARLTLAYDMLLAGVVTCGFAVFYNSAWKQVGMAIIGGMVGHGLRMLALDAGCTLDVATCLGCLGVGGISAWIAQATKTPVAVIAFAGAVTMMPGMQIYRAFAGALHLARMTTEYDAAAVTGTLANALKAMLVVCGLALGLIIGIRAVMALYDLKSRKTGSAATGDLAMEAAQFRQT